MRRQYLSVCRYRRGRCLAKTSWSRSHTHTHSNSDSNSNRCANGHGYSYSYGDSHASGDAYADADSNCNGNFNSNTDADPNCNPKPVRNSNSNRHHKPFCHADANIYCIASSDADTEVWANAKGSPNSSAAAIDLADLSALLGRLRFRGQDRQF